MQLERQEVGEPPVVSSDGVVSDYPVGRKPWIRNALSAFHTRSRASCCKGSDFLKVVPPERSQLGRITAPKPVMIFRMGCGSSALGSATAHRSGCNPPV